MPRKSKRKERNGAAALLLILIAVMMILTILYFNSQSGFLDGLFGRGVTMRTSEATKASIATNLDTSTQYGDYKNAVVLCDSQGVRAIGTDGNIQWQTDMNLNLPMMSIADKYILTADRSGRDINIINAGKIIHNAKADNSIISVKMKASGNYVLITEEPYYKGKVIVRNLRGEDVFAWYSGNAYVVDADISEDGKRLAVATLNTTGKLGANILLFDTTQVEPYQTLSFEGSAVTNLYFSKDGKLGVIADNKAMEISVAGDILWTYEYGDRVLEHAKITQSNQVVLALADSIGANTTIVILDRKGRQKGSITLGNAIRYFDICDDLITYNDKDTIGVAGMNGKVLYNINTDKDIRRAMFFPQSKYILGVTSVSLDVIEVR